MQPHQLRVVEERNELDEKLSKLGSFLNTEIFFGLPRDEQFRLRVQFGSMQTYSQILTERIANFG